MKQLFSLLVWMLLASTLSAQTYVIDGKIKHNDKPVSITVYEFNDSGGWNKIASKKAKESYTLALESDRDYQVWFTGKDGFTKVLAVNRGVMDVPEFSLDIDFAHGESAQIGRDEYGAFVITLIDTEFTALHTPFDLYP